MLKQADIQWKLRLQQAKDEGQRLLERVRTDAAKEREHAEGVLRDQIERVKDS